MKRCIGWVMATIIITIVIAFLIRTLEIKGENILSQENIHKVEYKVIKTDTLYNGNPESSRYGYTYITILQSISGKQYKVESSTLHNYCENNKSVLIEIKEYNGKQYNCFMGTILRLEEIK